MAVPGQHRNSTSSGASRAASTTTGRGGDAARLPAGAAAAAAPSPSPAAAKPSAAALADPAVSNVCRQLGCRQQAKQQTLGLVAAACVVLLAGAAPWSLPWVFVAWAAVALPWRVVNFCQNKWVFYLLDFCYFVNLVVLLFLLCAPNDRTVEALVYALADGPLAGALVAWQCPLVFSSVEHTTSVLMHLLPGLAVFAHRHFTPNGLRGWRGAAAAAAALARGEAPRVGAVPLPPAQPAHLAAALVAAPLGFYLAWQALYFVVVQLLCRRVIVAHGYETSYSCLARRAAKTNNVWNRLVRRGSVARRLVMYGLLQLAYTTLTLLVFLPTYFSFPLAVIYQVVKAVFPIYYGALHQMVKAPQHVFLQGISQLHAARQRQQEQLQADASASYVPGDADEAAAVSASPARRRRRSPAHASGLRLRSCAAEVAAAEGAQHQQGVCRSLAA